MFCRCYVHGSVFVHGLLPAIHSLLVLFGTVGLFRLDYAVYTFYDGVGYVCAAEGWFMCFLIATRT